MGSCAGAEWARQKVVVQKRREEAKKRTSEFADSQIVWELPESMSLRKERTTWYVNDERIIGGIFSPAFIYVLKDAESNVVRYVGQTSEPTRRYMEHRNDDKLGTSFKMFIVDIGDAETEREYITRHLAQGCELLNLVLTKPKTK